MTHSPLLVRPTNKTGRIHDVTPVSAGWTYVGFGLHRLKAGEAYGEATGEREVCLVIVGGKGRFAVDGEDFGELGERMSPFEGAPWALYVPAGFAHGFLTLRARTEVFYQMGEFHVPEAARGFRWNDPAFALSWPAAPQVISERDRTHPDFDPSRFDG